MKLLKLFLVFLLLSPIGIWSQNRKLEPTSKVVTKHQVTIKNKMVPYTATAGTQPVWDKDGKVIASLFYTYYQRSDIKDNTKRPLIISFNGGPGSASVWMHIAYTGPQILKIDDEGFPIQPYGITPNNYSILDVADIVFINPVNTGYSRIIQTDSTKKVDKKQFFGVNSDIKYLAEWVNTFVTHNNRWRSPKYLIGESYGTTRVAGLALALQNQQWMYLNGVIMVSPMDLGLKREGPVAVANRLPYFTAAAWYHKKLPPDLQQKDLPEVLAASENFTINTLTPALMHGGFISKAQRQAIAAKMAFYSGLKEKVILQQNLDVPNRFFWKELLRDEGFTIGRLDSRYKGIDSKAAGISPDYNAEITAWLHEFTPAINYYLREVLNYKTDIKYNMFGPVRPWGEWDNNHVGENLRLAMAENPYMHVMIQSGFFDGATQYFNAKYTLWHLDPSGKLKNRLHFKGYRSGHMMYLRHEDLKKANDDIRAFIRMSTPKKGQSAKY
jgi:carboxypeptidase C (cathepsin A)